jgi:hypothetical protein
MKKTLLNSFLKIAPVVLLLIVGHWAEAQTSILDVGLRLQKDVGLYTENGIAVAYSNKNHAPDRLYVGFSYFTSRLGTALNSNAIKQDNFLINAAWYFRRNHVIRPLAKANVGYFSSDYPAMFNMLPHSSLMASAEGGVCFQTHTPLKIATTFGYNLISGKGNNNTPGTLYPFYYQLTLSWNILKPAK